jgi:hypothetical protein
MNIKVNLREADAMTAASFGPRVHPPLPRPLKYAAALAVLIAVLDWAALAIDGTTVIQRNLAHGHDLPQAMFLWFRYFTILTNIGVAALMSLTAYRLYRHRPLPSAALYASALVYILVVCATYEAVLRTSWTPRGMGFDTDLTFHDIVPALVLVFWALFAPKRGLGWRYSLLLMIYPAIYFAGTLIAGALGETYPYSFLDVNKLGYPAVAVTGVVFLVIFYALGLATITASRRKRLKFARPARNEAPELRPVEQAHR